MGYLRSTRRKGSVISDYTYLFMQPGTAAPGPAVGPCPRSYRYW